MRAMKMRVRFLQTDKLVHLRRDGRQSEQHHANRKEGGEGGLKMTEDAHLR